MTIDKLQVRCNWIKIFSILSILLKSIICDLPHLETQCVLWQLTMFSKLVLHTQKFLRML